MKTLIATIAAALCAAHAIAAASPAATQAWVKNYIEKLNGNTNGVISVDAGTNGTITATFELFSERALVATNCITSVSAPIMNGTLFSYVGDGTYRNRQLGETIQATRTNFVWRSRSSVVADGFDTFVGAFSVAGTTITPSQKEALK